MKIIADTNIWYELGRNKDLFELVRNEPICPTYVNIEELSLTKNIIEKENEVRTAIQKMFNYKYNVIYEPPFFHLAKLYCNYEFDPLKSMKDLLEFTQVIAKGDRISDENREKYLGFVNKVKENSKELSDFFNIEAQKIKAKIKSKKEHRNKVTFIMVTGFIDYIVKQVTKNECTLEGIEFGVIELILKTLDTFFYRVETSSMKIQPNDWHDLAILAYVRQGDKYWTRERRWITLIKEAGCEEYLYTKF